MTDVAKELAEALRKLLIAPKQDPYAMTIMADHTPLLLRTTHREFRKAAAALALYDALTEKEPAS